MYKTAPLTCIPEMEAEEENMGRKWVPKKKHEVLKAKYKCLKKLFQIYDASVIGILPESNPEAIDEMKTNRRRKRSHNTKTDACAGTNELTSGDNTNSEYENTSVATAIFRELQNDQSCISTQIDTKIDTKIDKYAETISNTDLNEKKLTTNEEISSPYRENFIERFAPHAYPYPPYLILNERPKLTRFQCFVQRLFGIRQDAYFHEQMHASSDPTLTYREKRRRRGMRFRRLKRAKNIKSDSALRDLKSPSILSYVQSVQRYCLMDTTPRQCPIVGCKMMSYGIINYNDHLNICHFKDRKNICHYCHEGFEKECDKLGHENEHIGISRLSANMSWLSTPNQTTGNQADNDTKIQEEKLKKIVSFFDKISDPEQILMEYKKNRCSETNLMSQIGSVSCSDAERTEKTRTISCCNIRRKNGVKNTSSAPSDDSSRRYLMPFSCHICGESFNFRRQLSLHVDFEHRVRDKFVHSKFHSCAGIINRPRVDISAGSVTVREGTSDSESLQGVTTTVTESVAMPKSEDSLSYDPSTNIGYYSCDGIINRPHVDIISEDGSINVRCANESSSDGESLQEMTSTLTESSGTRRPSEGTPSCESTNIVYYNSVESLKKPSVVDSLVKKVRSYRWEPGTKIIRV